MHETIAISRVLVGLFFAISGYHKLFNKQRHKELYNTLKNDGIALPYINSWFVPSVEFIGGIFLIFGLFMWLSGSLLLIILIVACIVDAPKRVAEYKPIDLADALDDWLYLPEMLYIIILALIMMDTNNPYSLDYFIN